MNENGPDTATAFSINGDSSSFLASGGSCAEEGADADELSRVVTLRADDLATMTTRQPDDRRTPRSYYPLSATRAETLRNQAIHQRARLSELQSEVAAQEDRSRRTRVARGWQRDKEFLAELQCDPPAARESGIG
jgi:hypothetical protein